MFLFLYIYIVPSIFAAPIILQSSATLPPAISAGLDAASRLHVRLGALMSDMDTLLYTEEGVLSPNEMIKLVNETVETTDAALKDKILTADNDLREKAEELAKKGEKVDSTTTDSLKEVTLEELQKRIEQIKEELSEIVDDDENIKSATKKFALDQQMSLLVKRLYKKLEEMKKNGDFEKNIKESMKILTPHGPFGTVLV